MSNPASPESIGQSGALPLLESQCIRLDQCDSVLHIVLDRPECKNALNLLMYTDLVKAFEFASVDSSVRVVMLSGADGCFTSGNDLKDFMSYSDIAGDSSPVLRFIQEVVGFDKPIVAAIEGVAYGIGTTLLLHCDTVVANPECKLCLPFINLGLVPEFACSQLLPLRVGLSKASQWLMGGQPFSATEAHKHGLVGFLADSPVGVAESLAIELARKPPQALQATKRLLKKYSQGDLSAVIQEEVDAFSNALASPEFAEAAAAFFEKRQPQFKA